MSLAHATLGILMDGDQHGYQIATTLAERIPAGPFNTGQIHQVLERLETQGWAVSHPEPGMNRTRRTFSITPAGTKEFQAWLRRPVSTTRPVRDEMVIKVVFLGPHDPERLARLLETRRREHVRRLAFLQRETPRRAPLTGHEGFGRLARDAVRFREEAELRWVEHCLARLKGGGQSEGAGEKSDAAPEPAPGAVRDTRR